MKYIVNNQKGSVLLVSLLVLLVLTLLGIVALDTTDIELMISTNDRTYKEAFNAADGGGFTAIKVLRNTLDASEGLSLPSITYTEYPSDKADGAKDFYDEIIGTGAKDAGDQSEIEFSLSDNTTVAADVTLLRVVNIAGGGAEFAAGYSGVGANGPKGMRYSIESRASAPNATTSSIYLEYLKVLGTPGGL